MPFFETTGWWTVLSLELCVSNFGFSLVASLVRWFFASSCKTQNVDRGMIRFLLVVSIFLRPRGRSLGLPQPGQIGPTQRGLERFAFGQRPDRNTIGRVAAKVETNRGSPFHPGASDPAGKGCPLFGVECHQGEVEPGD